MKKEDFAVITEFDKRYHNDDEDRYHLNNINYYEDNSNVIISKDEFMQIINDRQFLFNQALRLRKIQRLFTE